MFNLPLSEKKLVDEGPMGHLLDGLSTERLEFVGYAGGSDFSKFYEFYRCCRGLNDFTIRHGGKTFKFDLRDCSIKFKPSSVITYCHTDAYIKKMPVQVSRGNHSITFKFSGKITFPTDIPDTFLGHLGTLFEICAKKIEKDMRGLRAHVRNYQDLYKILYIFDFKLEDFSQYWLPMFGSHMWPDDIEITEQDVQLVRLLGDTCALNVYEDEQGLMMYVNGPLEVVLACIKKMDNRYVAANGDGDFVQDLLGRKRVYDMLTCSS